VIIDCDGRMGTFVVFVSLLTSCVCAGYEVELQDMVGHYCWQNPDKEQAISGIAWEQYGEGTLFLEGTYKPGVDIEGYFFVDLYISVNYTYNGYDSWATRIVMRVIGEGAFAVAPQFRREVGELYSVDPTYSGDVLVRVHQGTSADVLGRVYHGTDPIVEIERAVLVVPEPGSVVLLGVGVLMLRRKMR